MSGQLVGGVSGDIIQAGQVAHQARDQLATARSTAQNVSASMNQEIDDVTNTLRTAFEQVGAETKEYVVNSTTAMDNVNWSGTSYGTAQGFSADLHGRVDHFLAETEEAVTAFRQQLVDQANAFLDGINSRWSGVVTEIETAYDSLGTSAQRWADGLEQLDQSISIG